MQIMVNLVVQYHKIKEKLSVTGFIYQLFVYGCFYLIIFHYRGLPIRYLSIKLLICLVVFSETIGAFYLIKFNRVVEWIYPISNILGFALISFFYIKVSFRKSSTFQNILIVGAGALLVFSNISELTFFKPFQVYAFFVLIICVSYLLQIVKYKPELKLLSFPEFFIFLGMSIFFSGSFMVMGLVNYIYQRNPALARDIFSINHFLNIIHYGLITYGLYLAWKSTKSSLSS
jgi:hypothetical protein